MSSKPVGMGEGIGYFAATVIAAGGIVSMVIAILRLQYGENLPTDGELPWYATDITFEDGIGMCVGGFAALTAGGCIGAVVYRKFRGETYQSMRD